MEQQNSFEREQQTISAADVGSLNDVLGNQIDAAAVTAQTAALERHDLGEEQGPRGVASGDTVALNDEQNAQAGQLGFDEHWINTREGNNKKWRDPAKEKRVKKIAAASRRRNRRK